MFWRRGDGNNQSITNLERRLLIKRYNNAYKYDL